MSYQSFEEVGSYCRENHINISAIDSSNIDILGSCFGRIPCDENYQNCHLRKGENLRFLDPKEGGSEFFKGLSILPKQKDLLLVFTFHRKSLRSYLDLDEENKVISDEEYELLNKIFYNTGKFLYFSAQLNDELVLKTSPNDFFINILKALEQTCEKVLSFQEDGAFQLIELSPTISREE